MLRTLIIEDELAARERLKRLLAGHAPEVGVVAETETITASVAWLRVHPEPDLILCDIHLADGSCFGIFKQIRVNCPVIFITAYDQYAIEAFRVNSIDYLLKPVKPEELRRSLDKLRETRPQAGLHEILERMAPAGRPRIRRFVVRQGQQIRAIAPENIALFYAEDGLVFLLTHDGERHIIDLTLENLENQTDPAKFYRINRSQILNVDAIARMHSYPKGRIKIELKTPRHPDCIVSSERTPGFRAWLGHGS